MQRSGAPEPAGLMGRSRRDGPPGRRRPARRQPWAAVLVIGALLAPVLVSRPRPAVAEASATPVPGSGTGAVPSAYPPFGLNVDLRPYGPDQRDAVLARLAGAGITHVRQPVSWAGAEPRRGQPDWAELDDLVAATDRHGVRLLVALAGAPAWARHDPAPAPGLWLCDDPAVTAPGAAERMPPTDPADFAAFAGRLAARYGPRLWAVEVWPEPNLMPNWRATGPDPEDYARLLGPAAAAVKAASPTTQVVSGGLAPTTDIGVCALSDVVFLDRLARTGALAGVDGVGIEPYGLRSAPTDAPAHRERLNFRRAEVLAQVLERHQVDADPWAVAWGWSAPPAAAVESPWGWHPADTAARWTTEAYALARARWPWLGPTFLMHLQPAAPAGDPVWGFALLDRDGSDTPAWAAAVELAAGRWPPPPPVTPWRPSPRQVSLAALALLALAALFGRRWLAPPIARALARVPTVPLAWLAVVYAAAALVDIAGPRAASMVAVPVMAVVATVAPAVAVGAVAFALPFYYSLDMWVGPQAFDGVEFLVLAAVGGRMAAWYLGLDTWSGGSAGFGPDPTALSRASVSRVVRSLRRLRTADWLVVALVAWAGLSLVWSEFREPAWRQWRTVIVEPALLYALLRTAPDRRAAARQALDCLVAGGSLAAAWGLVAVGLFALGLGGTGVLAEGVTRATGPYASPNNLALLVGRLVPVIGAYGLWSTGRRRRLYQLAAVPVLMGLVATFSRGALLVGLPATAVYLGLVAVYRTDRRRLLWGATALAGLAVLVAPFARTERLAGAFRLAPGSTGFIRLRLWRSAVAMGQDHAWGGVGLDNFLYLYRDRYVQRDAVQERFLNHPHNWLLDWWTRLGVVGLSLWLAVVAVNVRAGLGGLRRTGEVRLLAVAALGMQLYALAHGLVDNHFFLVDLAAVWWIAQAALLAAAEDD